MCFYDHLRPFVFANIFENAVSEEFLSRHFYSPVSDLSEWGNLFSDLFCANFAKYLLNICGEESPHCQQVDAAIRVYQQSSAWRAAAQVSTNQIREEFGIDQWDRSDLVWVPTLANGPDDPVPKLTPQLLSIVGKTPLYVFYPLQTNNACHQNLNSGQNQNRTNRVQYCMT